jgi:hypothetical protein
VVVVVPPHTHLTAGQSFNIKSANKPFESGAKFKYLRTAVTSQLHSQRNYEHVKLRNAYCQSIKNIMFSCFLSTDIKITVYEVIILPVFCVGVNLGLLP